MINFAWPWVFLVLPLPLVSYFILPQLRLTRDAALRVPFIEEFDGYSETTVTTQKQGWRFWIALIVWLLLVTAAARPQWLGQPVELPVSGRDLMLAVDLSGSMEEQDFLLNGEVVDRLVATKSVAGKFIERRQGDRIGLILFGERAYLQTPLTFDRKTVVTLLNESFIGLAGKKTAIGDAIGLAIKRLKDKAAESRVLILMTDGANTAGEVKPLKTAELAARSGLKVYTIGIGADAVVVRSLFGGKRVVNPSRDLDEKTLTAIAEQTGGRYFRARNTEQFEQIYALLDELEPVDQEAQVYRPFEALFYWPLTLALSLVMLLAALPAGRRVTVQ